MENTPDELSSFITVLAFAIATVRVPGLQVLLRWRERDSFLSLRSSFLSRASMYRYHLLYHTRR